MNLENIWWRLKGTRRLLDSQKSIELQEMFETMIKYSPSRINGRLSHPPMHRFKLRLEKYNREYWNVEHYFLLLNHYKEELII